MRNLKKILALVLALVMSLSLMAVASADDELNLGDVSDVYAESVDVLTGLKVFMGNKGEFLPKDNITRAEVAAIIYRIVTGDVTNSQNGIYADYNKFSDVTSDAWYAGYVNYCANAEYVKGVGYDANGKAMFKPQQNVTGYEALAMILRAIGYDRNNEFTGPSWQIQTAATARNRGILVNIQEGTLGTAATREAVAEILCKTILVPVADYSLAFGYRTTDANGKDNETLAYKTFKMEKIDGVVVANEYANLETTTTLGATQTKLNTKLGDYTLNVASTLDDIGESRYVYVIPQTGSTRFDLVCSKVYEDESLNKVYETNDKADISDSKFASTTGMTKGTATEQYLNFGDGIDWKSDWRIKYVITLLRETATPITLTGGPMTVNGVTYPVVPANLAEYNAANQEIQRIAAVANLRLPLIGNWDTTNNVFVPTADSVRYTLVATGVAGRPNDYFLNTYEREFVINADITPDHQHNIERIFNTADRTPTGTTVTGAVISAYFRGEVYVGTSSLEDVSDKKSFEQFKAEYIKADEMDPITANEYGNWLKVIDNNNDGIAEYILKTVYTFAQVTAVDADGKVTLDTHGVNNTWADSADTVNNLNNESVVCADELAVGNVVYYALIDGKAQTYVPEMVTTKFDSIDRNALTATTAEGTTYHEGGVHSHSTNTSLEQGVARLSGTYTYDVYLTRGGHLGVFTHNPTSTWTLLTNGWYNQQRGGVEYAGLVYNDENGQQVDTTITSNGSLFIGNLGNPGIQNNNWNAIKALGNSANGTGVGALNDATGTRAQVMTAVAYLSADGALVPVDRVYNNRDIHMIDLGTTIPNSRAGVTTGVAYNTSIGATTAYNNQLWGGANVEVRPLSTTVYYYVYPNGTGGYVVDRYVGFGSAPSVSRATDIEDVYAVASLTSRNSNLAGAPTGYYTAEVVVVELNHNYRQRGEQIFIYDMPSAGTSITRETINYIDSKGAVQTAEVDLTGSNLGSNRNYLSAYGKTIAPGLYYKYPTTTEGVYTIEQMTYAEIAANNYVVGQSLTQNAINRNNYVEIDAWTWTDANGNGAKDNAELARSGNTPEYSLTATSGIYRLGYTGDAASAVAGWNYKAELDTCGEADDLTAYLGERVDVTTNPTAAAVTAGNYDHTPYDGTGNTWWNNNDLLIAYSGNNIVYAISFKNLTSTGGVNFAQSVWQEAIPLFVQAQNTNAPTVTLLDKDGNLIQALIPGDNDIHYAAWKALATQNAKIRIVPAADNEIAVSGKGTFNNKTLEFTLAELIGSATDESVTVMSQSTRSGAVARSDTYTIHYVQAVADTDLYYRGVRVADADIDAANGNMVEYAGPATSLKNLVADYTANPATNSKATYKLLNATGRVEYEGDDFDNVTYRDGWYLEVTITDELGNAETYMVHLSSTPLTPGAVTMAAAIAKIKNATDPIEIYWNGTDFYTAYDSTTTHDVTGTSYNTIELAITAAVDALIGDRSGNVQCNGVTLANNDLHNHPVDQIGKVDTVDGKPVKYDTCYNYGYAVTISAMLEGRDSYTFNEGSWRGLQVKVHQVVKSVDLAETAAAAIYNMSNLKLYAVYAKDGSFVGFMDNNNQTAVNTFAANPSSGGWAGVTGVSYGLSSLINTAQKTAAGSLSNGDVYYAVQASTFEYSADGGWVRPGKTGTNTSEWPTDPAGGIKTGEAVVGTWSVGAEIVGRTVDGSGNVTGNAKTGVMTTVSFTIESVNATA